MKTANLTHLENEVAPFKKKGNSLIPQMPVLPSGGVGTLESYISAVNQMPMLTAAEEIEFAKKLQDENDLESARRLILSHLRLVVSVSRQYLGYGLPHADLIQEGNIGLMKAVKRFDVNQGVRLVSYAIFWIKAEIHEFILKNWRLVRVATTKPQRKLFFNLRSNKPTLNALSTDEVRDLALALDVNQHDVREMEIRLSGADVALEPENDDGEVREQGSWMSDSSLEPTQVLMKQEDMHQELEGLQVALSSLDDRSRRIIESRWLPNIVGGTPLTLHDLADELHISAERVRQIEATALKKMRSALGA
ncbi:RNA polymerase sigma factor RpoH [Polynucleobacter kasalickyi]|uniref:RNA polymerase sigma factor n=1 Tax=Polynucleobacter kasalickyi TaxID=1938817 RepID=A0A1W2AQW8_9BURK|nr:RNA polymerase, sigma 32 subunit, RpoH [Polynucleobacter kasalickyi]